jgi:GTP cyclohydrolase II
MLNADRGRGSSLLGEPNFVAVERGIAEFRAARPVAITAGPDTIFILPVDGINDTQLSAFLRLAAPALPRLILTARRAHAIGIDTAEPIVLPLPEAINAKSIYAIAASRQTSGELLDWTQADAAAVAALTLAKLAFRLPALLAVKVEKAALLGFNPPVVTIPADAVAEFRDLAIESLKVASEALVPLHGDINARFVVFRGIVGGESAAIVVNDPDFSKPVAVRLHSACLTGDVFGSRRCDCGDQLRLALKQLAATGGGVILYLDQEGRGLGLANKMRAYELQDEGLDTVDANITLGFDDDERDYGVAGRMLDLIGCAKVKLMTNNPNKISGLVEAGIEITDRVPLLTPVNGDNLRYLTAKAARAGHSLDHLFETLAVKDNSIIPDKADAAS